MNSLFYTDQRLISPADSANPHCEYQAECVIPDGVKTAVLRFYAANLTEIFLNGKSIHQGPCRSAPPRLYYDEITLTPTPGIARLRFHQCVDDPRREPGILCELELVTEEGALFLLQNPADYRVRPITAYRVDVPRNFGTGYAEHVDFAAAEAEWGAVKPGTTLLNHQHFHLRPIPCFTENVRHPLTTRVEEDNSILFDFGSIVFGRGELAATGEGEVVIEYIEALEGGWISPQGTIVMYSDKVLNANGSFYWKGFHKRAFRYVRLRHVRPEGLSYRVLEYNYPLKRIGDFRSSDKFLNRLARISEETLAVCMDDIYNDCPHRDQAQWMDAFAAAQAALGLFGVSDLTRKCLVQYALCSCRNGKIVSPSVTGVTSFVDYVLMMYRFMQWYYHCSDDTGLIEEVYDALTEALRGFYPHESADHLLDYAASPGEIIYLDNTFELAKNGKSTALNALYLGALDVMREFAELLDRKADAKEFSARSHKVRNAIRDVCAHPEIPGCFRDNARSCDREFMMVNFSCELGKWSGSSGVLTFNVDSDHAAKTTFVYAAYDHVRIFLNNELLRFDQATATWRDQPVYEAKTCVAELRRGCNTFRFEVKSNSLNWELFFRLEDEPVLRSVTIFECDWDTGEARSPARPLELRCWIPPQLSQSTQAYCATSGVHLEKEMNQVMLRNILKDVYPRTYLSVRVPYFCEENKPPTACPPWVMPTNTPWSTFFLLTALFENDLEAEALQTIRRYWERMVASGAVNTWEEWGNNSSLCHAWGAVPVYFMQRHILGVHHDTLHLGYLLIRPNLFDLNFAEGSVALIDTDKIDIKLERRQGETFLQIHAPDTVKIKLDTSLLANCIIGNDSKYVEVP